MSMRAVCIAGPTASGKSALALALAQHLGAEIISMDSALVYRGMDIGTAKPSAQELALIPHHLINLLEPTQAYSAAEFARDAGRLIGEINARGKLALVVGGTMLYYKALTNGLSDLPQADDATRARIDAQAAECGWPAMHALLAAVDASTAARLSPNDSQRIQRALEVHAVSGKALSAWIAEQTAPSGLDVPMLSLEPTHRGWLHTRIAQRFAAMLQAGLVEEVQALKARGDLQPQMASMRCVGYRQTWDALDAGLSGEPLRQELMQTGVAATRQLAKRQLTWLRSWPERTVLACDAMDAAQQLREAQRWAAGLFPSKF